MGNGSKQGAFSENENAPVSYNLNNSEDRFYFLLRYQKLSADLINNDSRETRSEYATFTHDILFYIKKNRQEISELLNIGAFVSAAGDTRAEKWVKAQCSIVDTLTELEHKGVVLEFSTPHDLASADIVAFAQPRKKGNPVPIVIKRLFTGEYSAKHSVMFTSLEQEPEKQMELNEEMEKALRTISVQGSIKEALRKSNSEKVAEYKAKVSALGHNSIMLIFKTFGNNKRSVINKDTIPKYLLAW